MASAMRRWGAQSGTWWSVFIGFGFFAAGFGVFSLAWYIGQWRKDVPGFWDYRSPTIGDGLLLPVAAAFLILAGANSRSPGPPTPPQERR